MLPLRERRIPSASLLAYIGCLTAGPLGAQQPVTRAQAVSAALERGARTLLGRADTAATAAALHAARLYQNPSLSASWSQDPPHDHALASLPLDLPWLRSARIGAAASTHDAARYGFAFERALIRFDTDTSYTRALAAFARARLSWRNARDADSVLTMARLRHEVGDASELDVRLAEVNAGQVENTAVDDSLAAVGALLAIQLAMGLPADEPTITLVDSLASPSDTVSSQPAEPLPVAAAAASLRASERALTLAHRSLFPSPSLEAGFDKNDPGGQQGLLPTVGLSLTLPLFNQNGGDVAQARASRDRAQANLDLVRRETTAELARAHREQRAALARLARDRRLLASADRVAAMSLKAYAEGAVALPNVLEAQRNAREALGRYIDDVATANNAAAAVQLTSMSDQP
ncbi:MAG TPA: TolC family protein [Gemmatimonadales bacterium]|nr:TolC family protein [Gemmatimonadales bacterium]